MIDKTLTDNEIIKEMQEIRRSVMAHKELTDEIAQDFLHIDQEYTGGSKVWLTTDFFKKVFKHFCHSNFLVKTIELTFEYIIRQEAEAEKKQEEINRQKAEIERLQKDSKDIDDFARNICKERLLQGKAIADFDSLRKYVKTQKAEAVKEFAEKVQAEIKEALESNYKARAEKEKKELNKYLDNLFWNYCTGKIDCLRGIDNFIDNLVKEMVVMISDYKSNCKR